MTNQESFFSDNTTLPAETAMAGETVVGTTPDGVVWVFFKEEGKEAWRGIGLLPEAAAAISLALMQAANMITAPPKPEEIN